ncbi:MAG: hypothetical protein IT427_09365 [Pirellulales bacterium]|nr:hypothetical protein [Pirellulales bacterium]
MATSYALHKPASGQRGFAWTAEDEKKHPRNESGEWTESGSGESGGSADFFSGPPVVSLGGNEFPKSDEPLTRRVGKFFSDQYNGRVIHPTLGEVVMNERSVKDSIAHGLGREKAIAFAAVPEVIRKGKIVAEEADAKAKGLTGVVVAAPISIADKPYLAAALIRRDKNTQRFYLHEVVLKEKLQQDTFKTGASADESGEPSGVSTGAIRSILRNLLPVNREKGGESATYWKNLRPVIYRADDRAAMPMGGTASGMPQHRVGETKTVGDTTYRLNENHRWELADADAANPSSESGGSRTNVSPVAPPLAARKQFTRLQ